MAVYGSPQERERFFHSIGMSEKELEKRLPGYDFYLQGYDKFHEESLNKRCVFAYSGAVKEYLKNDLMLTHRTIEEKENFKFKETIEYDNVIFFEILSYSVIKIIDITGATIGLVDTLGNIHLTDFYHNKNPFPIDFVKFIKKYSVSFEDIITNQFLKTIKNISAYKIKEIKIEFDREAYERKVAEEMKKELTRLMDTQRKFVKNLKEYYSMEIESMRRKIQEGEKRGFIEGLKTGMKFKKDWKIEGDWLKYTKRIYVKRVKAYGRIYKINEKRYYISGLKVFIAPEIYNDHVRCSRAYHPNCNAHGNVCIGDLEGKPINEVIEKLPKVLETCNLDSAYDNEATAKLREVVDFGELEEMGVVWDA